MHVDCNLDFKAPEVIQRDPKRDPLPFDTLAITHSHLDHCLHRITIFRTTWSKDSPGQE